MPKTQRGCERKDAGKVKELKKLRVHISFAHRTFGIHKRHNFTINILIILMVRT